MPALVDLTGERFGRLTVKAAACRRNGQTYWTCVCDCGELTTVKGANLRRGASKSCGCRRKETGGLTRTHGESKSSEYASFATCKARCTNPNNEDYARYGGRGVEFRFASFDQFYKELGRRPAGKSVDRIDSNKHYEPGNVRWATAREQSRNRDYTVKPGKAAAIIATYEAGGVTMKQVADMFGVCASTVSNVVKRGLLHYDSY